MRAIIWSATIIVLAGLAIHVADTYDFSALTNFRRPYVIEKLALETICPFVSVNDHNYQACRVYSATGFIYDAPHTPSRRTEAPAEPSPPTYCGDDTPGAPHYRCTLAPVPSPKPTSMATAMFAAKEAGDFVAWEATPEGKETSAKAAAEVRAWMTTQKEVLPQ